MSSRADKPIDPALLRLRALASGFRRRCVDELGDYIARLRRDDPTVAAELGPLLHRLAGSGPTFGFNDLGRRARALHRRLRAAGAVPPLPVTLIAELEAMLRGLQRAPLPTRDPARDSAAPRRSVGKR